MVFPELPLGADLLRARGFVATTTRDAGKLQASDAEQMACAVGRQETLLTHNRADFEALVRTHLATKSSGDTKTVPARNQAVRLFPRPRRLFRSRPESSVSNLL
jgi:hypothetical protein